LWKGFLGKESYLCFTISINCLRAHWNNLDTLGGLTLYLKQCFKCYWNWKVLSHNKMRHQKILCSNLLNISKGIGFENRWYWKMSHRGWLEKVLKRVKDYLNSPLYIQIKTGVKHAARQMHPAPTFRQTNKIIIFEQTQLFLELFK
jgi:hypothetical protein